MTKSKSTMNLVPVILIFVLILGAGYLLLKDTLKLPWFRKDNTVEITRINGFPLAWDTEKVLEKKREVIKDQVALKNFLESVDITDTSVYDSVLSQVNFDREFLLGVASDTQDATEGMIRIKRVEIDKKEKSLGAVIIQYKPDSTCVPEVKKNVLVDIVRISKTENAIGFDVVRESRSCN